MAQLTNVSRVSNMTVTRRVRALAGFGQVLLPIGQAVGPTHIVARGPSAAAFSLLRAGEALKVSPGQIEKMLLVKVGAVLERGQPLLSKPKAFGGPRVLRAPTDGTLVLVRDGCLVLQRADEVKEVRALLQGRIVSILPDRGVIIEAAGSVIQAAWDSGKSIVGHLRAPERNADGRLAFEDIGPEAGGAVLFGGFVDDVRTLTSLEERGALGLVTGSMPAELCMRAREMSFPVLLTEGAGHRPMAEPILELLYRSKGREVSLLAENRVHRYQPAEIVIAQTTSGPPAQEEARVDSLQTGSLVRLLGMGEQTLLGRVSRIHVQPRRTAHGGMAAGADVVLPDGRAVFAPYANLDLIG
jgi:hypothetical protein